MTDLVLLIFIGVLAGLLAWEKHTNKEERDKLINALLSKNAAELRDLEFVAKLPKQQEEKIPSDFVAIEDLSDEDFDKHIEETLKNGQN